MLTEGLLPLWAFACNCRTCESALTALIIQKDGFTFPYHKTGEGCAGKTQLIQTRCKANPPLTPSKGILCQKSSASERLMGQEALSAKCVCVFPHVKSVQLYFQQAWRKLRWLMCALKSKTIMVSDQVLWCAFLTLNQPFYPGTFWTVII